MNLVYKEEQASTPVYVVDAKSNEKYFVVKCGDIELFKVAKSTNSLEKVINMIGRENIKEVIE